VEERKKIAGLQPERADVILAGALIVYTILRSLKVNSLTGSNRGLRCAILLNVLKENFF
jgi:exopolyphosphatase/guanosine-5'-triphosphate,3'-diphosphate pyrophosphatase